MNDDDLYGPKLTPAPQTSPIVRGTAVALVTVSLAVAGCANNPGVPATDSGNPGARVVDAGLTIPPDAGADATPGVDVGPDDAGAHPGVPALDTGPGVDSGIDADNPGDHT